MVSIYYSAFWTDSGFLISCCHEHPTIREASYCITCAGAYVLATENGVLRKLSFFEEAEFQLVVPVRTAEEGLDPLEAVKERYSTRGPLFAVMVRIKSADRYKWTTWMTYEIYGEAAAHAGRADRIVVFSSPEWLKLKKHTEPVRRQSETLVEYVRRFLEAYGVSQRILTNEDRKYFHTSALRVELPDFVEVVCDWLNQWELKELERIHALEAPARLEGAVWNFEIVESTKPDPSLALKIVIVSDDPVVTPYVEPPCWIQL